MPSPSTNTQQALYAQIEEIATNAVPKLGNAIVQAQALRDLALAYRFAAGGPQPGSPGA